MNSKKFILATVMLVAILTVIGVFWYMDFRDERDESILSDFLESGCTSILVGKDASVDGSTTTTHACDCHICDFTWHHVPAADHKPGEVRKIYAIDQYKTWPQETGGKWSIRRDLRALRSHRSRIHLHTIMGCLDI